MEVVAEEHRCFICQGLLMPPVVLPCTHRICEQCFFLVEEKANLTCPLCRK